MIFDQKIFSAFFLQMSLVVAMALAGLSPMAVHAQINPEIANCSEMKDDATQTQAEICSAHAGCRLVFAIHKTCVKAKQFINNLKTAIGDGVQGFFGRNKDVTPDAIFEASLGTTTRALSTVPEVKDMAAGIRNEVRNVRGEVLKGTGEGNVDWVYYGQVNDGKAEGIGTRIFSDGSLARGSFKDNELHGNGETINKGDSRHISEFDKRLRTGKGAFANEAGSSFVGTFERNNMKEGTIITSNGFRFEGTFQNNNISQGRLFGVDGRLLGEGRYEDNTLLVGKSYDASGNATQVNLPADRQLAAAAAREAEERNRRDAEANRQAAEHRKRDDEARAAQVFRDNLGTMNPGQLFAKADELSSQGDKVRAREVLRALVSRYPDHALADSAARQLLQDPQIASRSIQTNSQSTQAFCEGGEIRHQHNPQKMVCFRNGVLQPDGSPEGQSASSVAVATVGNCAQRAEAVEANFTRRLSTIPANNRVGQLGLLYSVTKTVSEIWMPCNPAKARSYLDTAESTLRTCSAIATTPSVCMPNINW